MHGTCALEATRTVVAWGARGISAFCSNVASQKDRNLVAQYDASEVPSKAGVDSLLRGIDERQGCIRKNG